MRRTVLATVLALAVSGVVAAPAPGAGQVGALAPSAVGRLSAPASSAVPSSAVPSSALSGIPWTRVAGLDRYATAVEVSRRLFPEGPLEVIVASGESAADTIAAAGLATVTRHPLLLVRRDEVPRNVMAEIRRRGGSVTIVGGEASVSSAVENRLEGITTRDSVSRLGGADRYETALAVSRDSRYFVWGDYTISELLLVSDAAPADALAAAQLSASRFAPFVHTDRGALPAATVEAIRLLEALNGTGPVRVTVVGGPRAVPDSVLDRVRAVRPDVVVDRIGGADRYETSRLLSLAVRPRRPSGPMTVYLASGTRFPDAFVSAPAAGFSPLLLTRPRCHPAPTVSELVRLGVDRVVVVGGEGAVASGDVPCA